MAKTGAKKKMSGEELTRTPVVAVLGHVDHGKTSLLDAIRKSKVQESEEGGITQSIRGHKVEVALSSGEKQNITFIDTPGHEVFSDMRSRGAHITDIALLVVAADDGVMPQTKEAISFIKKAKVPVVVAINKIDLPTAQPDKVKQQLSKEDIVIEEFGGDVIAVEVSATKNKNIDELLETLILVAQVNGLKEESAPGLKAKTIVLESTLSKHLGATSFVLVKAGTLWAGDYVAWTDGYSKVRSIKDENLKNLEEADVSDPVWIVGLDQVLPTGETLYCFEKEADAKNHIQVKEAEEVKESSEESEETSDEDMLAALFEGAKEDTRKILKVVLRADVQGSLEVLETELKKLEDDDVGIEIITSSTGDITEDDIQKAKNVKGVIIGFRSGVSSRVKKIAQRQKVLLMTYELIYELLDDVDEALSSLIEPEEEEVEVAVASVKKIFDLTNGDVVAGCNVTKGTIIKGYRAFVRRQDERIGEGKITSLRHLKNEVKEAKKGSECGILLEPKVEVQEGDEIVCFKVEKV